MKASPPSPATSPRRKSTKAKHVVRRRSRAYATTCCVRVRAAQVLFDNGQRCVDTSDGTAAATIATPCTCAARRFAFPRPDGGVRGRRQPRAVGNAHYANVAVYDPARKLGVLAIDAALRENTAARGRKARRGRRAQSVRRRVREIPPVPAFSRGAFGAFGAFGELTGARASFADAANGHGRQREILREVPVRVRPTKGSRCGTTVRASRRRPSGRGGPRWRCPRCWSEELAGERRRRSTFFGKRVGRVRRTRFKIGKTVRTRESDHGSSRSRLKMHLYSVRDRRGARISTAAAREATRNGARCCAVRAIASPLPASAAHVAPVVEVTKSPIFSRLSGGSSRGCAGDGHELAREPERAPRARQRPDRALHRDLHGNALELVSGRSSVRLCTR